MKAFVVVVSVVCAIGLAGCSGSGVAAPPPRPDASGTVWLCRPGLPHDPCTASLRTTVVDSDGATHVVEDEPAPDPPIDCFYVYPNVSRQRTDNADLDIEPQETAIAELEASPFSRVCRVYAPMYREDTGRSSGDGPEQIAEHSVQAAWRDYLAHDNKGRGVVLIGHSEGAFQLGQLIIDQIEHNPKVRPLLVSAVLTGGNLPVRSNGTLLFDDQQIQPCRSDDQTDCVVGYDAYSKTPPSDSRFGRQPKMTYEGSALRTLCTNPASLSGGTGALLSLYRTHLPTEQVEGSTAEGIFGSRPPTSSTPWIEYDGGYSAQCVTSNGATVLLVDSHRGAPALTAPRTTWGLHVDDPNLALGNLVAIVRSEASAYVAQRPVPPPA